MYHTEDESGYIEKDCICCNCQFLTLFLTPQHYINWTAYFALRDHCFLRVAFRNNIHASSYVSLCRNLVLWMPQI